VPVHRPDVVKAKGLEQGAREDQMPSAILDAAQDLENRGADAEGVVLSHQALQVLLGSAVTTIVPKSVE